MNSWERAANPLHAGGRQYLVYYRSDPVILGCLAVAIDPVTEIIVATTVSRNRRACKDLLKLKLRRLHREKVA